MLKIKTIFDGTISAFPAIDIAFATLALQPLNPN
jgi:hypothetical protein